MTSCSRLQAGRSQPPGFEEHEQSDHVYRLYKASYWLKQDQEYEEAPPSTQGKLPSAVFETAPGSFPKPVPSTLALLPKVSYAEYDMEQILEECDLLQHVPGSKEKQPITQMTFDLHTATARVAELKGRMHNSRMIYPLLMLRFVLSKIEC
ncbi:hypothetical protein HAX54_041350 [Datura stramonium]|uniref:Uncharacterized protein n=1 Tax=Datura stramonium TaxID=4076 RepID=A0ABS8SKW5_DATST|nr:hypothetical protein [Datura stramonium]